MDPYKVLGVSLGATAREIKSAYYKLAREHHPDRNGGDESVARFKEVAEAYSVLCELIENGGITSDAVSSLQALYGAHADGVSVASSMMPKGAKEAVPGGCEVRVVRRSRAFLEAGGVIELVVKVGGESTEIALNVPPNVDKMQWCRVPRLGPDGQHGGEAGDLLLVFMEA